jgi:3-dehydrotetronate 4-kinase
MTVLLGAIADDFTGATDLANTLVKAGMRVTQAIGVPDSATEIGDAQAVVVALKSRTNTADEAVAWSLAALAWLRRQGTQQIVFKYCSTFDSTSSGNIGPVADVLLDALHSDFAFVCPAFPQNGRSVYRGHLFVGDELLAESPMKDHPLTPMRDSNLLRLMAAQSSRKVGLINIERVRAGVEAIRAAVQELRSRDVTYAVIDALDDADLRRIGAAAVDHALVTGSSAVALALPENFRAQGKLEAPLSPELPAMRGRAVVFAGSCSGATRRQIAAVRERWPVLKLDVDRIANGEDIVGAVVSWSGRQDPTIPVLIYSSADPDEVSAIQQRYGVKQSGAMIEQSMAAIARQLVDDGFDRIVVAGGETSGAVVSALQIRALSIGPEIDPGVPWTQSLGNPPLALALKSGNFGAEDFFLKAFEVLR